VVASHPPLLSGPIFAAWLATAAAVATAPVAIVAALAKACPNTLSLRSVVTALCVFDADRAGARRYAFADLMRVSIHPALRVYGACNAIHPRIRAYSSCTHALAVTQPWST